MTITQKVEQCLDTIRPALAMHKGNVELVGVDEGQGIVKVKFLGGCQGCPMSTITLKMGIEAEILEKVPEINEVVAVGVDEAFNEEKKCGCGGDEHNDGCGDDENAWFKELVGEETK